MIDTRATRTIFRVDMGFYVKVISWALQESSYRIHVFWIY